MLPYTITTLTGTCESFQAYYLSKYGKEKVDKIITKVNSSSELTHLSKISIQRSGTPTSRDFLSALKGTWYFTFSGTDTTILACLLAIKKWDREVNTIYSFASPAEMNKKV